MHNNKPLAQTGLLVSVAGAHAEIEDEHGQRIRCHVRKNADAVNTGDQVFWQLEGEQGHGVIVGYHPRKSLLFRPENKHKNKLIAANIDSIVIVTSPPTLSEEMLDRYLVATEMFNIPACILVNKIDLLDKTEKAKLQRRLATYEKIGYPLIYSSTLLPEGLAEYEAYSHSKMAVLVGTSGVGKSSIISALTANTAISIGEISAKGLGKHTTTATYLYHLPRGGCLIDSPGVREFGLWHLDKKKIAHGFIEFKAFASQCKFRDCQHQKEPACAVQQAVADRQIAASRFENYCRIVAGLNSLR